MMGKYRYLLLAAAPFLLLCVFLLHTTSQLPVSDQWAMVPFIEKWHAGSLTFQDLFRQHVEHRMFFPWLLLLSVAAATHWNLYYEVAANLFLGVLICALFFYQIRKLEIYFKENYGPVYFLTAVFVFSVAQSNNWFCAQAGPYLSILSFTAGTILLSSPAAGWKQLVGAAAAGIIGTYSFANGMFFWGIGFLVLCARPLERKKTVLASWAAVSALVAAGYLWGLHRAPGPSLLFSAQHPLRAAEYFFVFLGGALLPFERFTALIGSFGLFCFTAAAFTAYYAFREARRDQAALLLLFPWFALAAFCVISAAGATVGRAGFGLTQATASRYVTTSNLLCIFLLVLAPVAARSFLRGRTDFPAALARSRALRWAGLILFFALQAAVIKQKWFWETVRKDELTVIGNALLAGEYDEQLIKDRIYGPGDLRGRIAVLKKYRLALFRGAEPGPAAPAGDRQRPE